MGTFVFCALFLAIPSHVLAHGDYHDVVRNLTPRIQADPENTKLRYQLVAAHVEHDEWKLALAECDRIEKLAPGKHQLGYFRGRSLATAERWQDALAPLDEFLSSASAHEEARVWRARVHLQLKDQPPDTPPSGLATGSFNGLHTKSKFLAMKINVYLRSSAVHFPI